MGEIMSNYYNNNIWNTTATTSDGTSNYMSNTFTVSTDNMWFPYYMESTWVPYTEVKYKPKWHIKLGYKNQINRMWD